MRVYYQPVLTKEEWETSELFSFMVYRSLANAKQDYPKHIIAAYVEGEIENPTFVDDMDERTLTFYVDIPSSESEEWITIETFKSHTEAVIYAQMRFNADENGMISLISQS